MSADLAARLRRRADKSRVPGLQRFFKTGPGEYAEGDLFIGVTVPDLRQVCRECRDAAIPDILALLGSAVHEERLLALLLLVETFRRGTDETKREIYRLYLANTRFINNWDLVDSSAPQIVGAWLFTRSRAPLRRLARSSSVWERRIAIIATQFFIRNGDLDETFRIADLLLTDHHDLIHKAVGWMLREAGNRDPAAERAWLATRYPPMPRTMLRYAIEKFPEAERRRYLAGTI
jgi:3-methyladenine DNA glycosylase AlkD